MSSHKKPKPFEKSLTAAQRAAAARTVAAPPLSSIPSWDREDAERQRSRESLMARGAYWVYGAGL